MRTPTLVRRGGHEFQRARAIGNVDHLKAIEAKQELHVRSVVFVVLRHQDARHSGLLRTASNQAAIRPSPSRGVEQAACRTGQDDATLNGRAERDRRRRRARSQSRASSAAARITTAFEALAQHDHAALNVERSDEGVHTWHLRARDAARLSASPKEIGASRGRATPSWHLVDTQPVRRRAQ
jgi:hypothetical protein